MKSSNGQESSGLGRDETVDQTKGLTSNPWIRALGLTWTNGINEVLTRSHRFWPYFIDPVGAQNNYLLDGLCHTTIRCFSNSVLHPVFYLGAFAFGITLS